MTLNARLVGALVALMFALPAVAAAQDEWGDDSGSDETAPDDGDPGGEAGGEASAEGAMSLAGDDTPTDGGTRKKFPVRLLAAFKAGGGGNYQNVPDAPPMPAPFDDGAGGWGAIVGVTVQATVFKGLLGLEMGLLYDWGYSWSKLSQDPGNRETEWGYEFSTMRFPLLLEIGTPGDGSRLAFGTGPEFAFGGDALVKASSSTGGTNDEFPAGAHTSTFWVFNLGAELAVEDFLAVTFDIHYAMNLDSEAVYADRFDGVGAAAAYQARNDHELRLMLGIGYAYDLEI